MKSKARLTKVTRAFLSLLFPNTSSLTPHLQRLQLLKILWKTTRIQTISGLVNTADLRYSRHRCGKIRRQVSQPANYLGNTYVIIMCCASVHLSNADSVFAHSMVAQAGQSSDWPVFPR